MTGGRRHSPLFGFCRASSRDEDAQTADDGRRHSGHSGHGRIGILEGAISSKRSNRSIKKASKEGGETR
jgi:hypothetical protein